jgi:hypothetical protein
METNFKILFKCTMYFFHLLLAKTIGQGLNYTLLSWRKDFDHCIILFLKLLWKNILITLIIMWEQYIYIYIYDFFSRWALYCECMELSTTFNSLPLFSVCGFSKNYWVFPKVKSSKNLDKRIINNGIVLKFFESSN